MKKNHFDVLIVGAGLAGASLASLLPSEMKVGMVIKCAKNNLVYTGSSIRAQGGIAGAMGEDDSVAQHAADTLQVACGLADKEVVNYVTAQAPAAINWLSERGVCFDRQDGKLSLAQEGGHAQRRVVHVADETGAAIMSTLVGQLLQQSNLIWFENCFAIKVILNAKRTAAIGIEVQDQQQRQRISLYAKHVVLATGGAGKAYLYTTNSPGSSGDGIALAYEAGCDIRNMEFYQFHPTCLYHEHYHNFLFSEALRGEGAKLVDAKGEQLLYFDKAKGAENKKLELLPRDQLAQIIDRNLKSSGDAHICLDLRSFSKQYFKHRFRAIFAQCELIGIDPTQDLVPVVPAAHYCCGGIKVDLHARTSLANLYAIGECASTGLHGANRLASNSLLECVVFARRLAEDLNNIPQDTSIDNLQPSDSNNLQELSADTLSTATATAIDKMMIRHNWLVVRQLMWSYVGIYKNHRRLLQARDRLAVIEAEIEPFVRAQVFDTELYELYNIVICAKLITEGALARVESRGLHWVEDYAQPKQRALDIVINRQMFAEQVLNELCPFSSLPIVRSALARWRGRVVGFCNPWCRDSFVEYVEHKDQCTAQQIAQGKAAEAKFVKCLGK